MLLHRFLLPAKNFCGLKSMNVKKSFLVSNFTTSINFNSSFKDNKEDLNSVSLFNIKKTIKLSNVGFEEQFANIKTKCPACSCLDGSKDEEDKAAHTIYINKTTGNFRCPSCRYGGKWGLIEKFFTANKTPKTINELKTYQSLFLTLKKNYQRSNDLNHKAICENFELITLSNVHIIYEHYNLDEKIPKSSLITLQGRFNPKTNEILIPLVDIDGKTVGYKIISKNEPDEDYVFKERTLPENNCSGLLLYHNSKSKSKESSKLAIIVLNVLDLLALTQTKVSATFICLPHGLKFLPQECLPTLEKFPEPILWFNYNTAGWDVARNFAKKLDEKRCMFVRPTQSHPTPYRAILQNIEIKSILSKSEPILHKAITTFSSLRQDVLSDLQNIDKVQGVKWKRYPLLNKYLKGHRKGELTILTGPTGSGKTTFMSDYSLDLAMQGVNTLWGSFEIRNTRLASTLLRQFAGKPLLEKNGFAELKEFDEWADKFENLPIYFMTFHGEQAIKVVLEAIDHAAYVHDVNHVIIDNVQFMMGMSEDVKHIDRFWKQDAIIASFRTFATRKNCHVTLVIHPRKEKDSDELTTSSIFGGAKAAQEADNVLIIQDKRLTAIKGKKYLQIAKNRYSGDLGIMPLDFDKQSLSYAHKPKKPKEDETPTTELPELLPP